MAHRPNNVVIGVPGQLGSELTIAAPPGLRPIVPLAHAMIDVTDAVAVSRLLRELRPTSVINTAALHDLTRCENLPDEAFRVNALGALNVARACASLGARCVYISTDYVFGDGDDSRVFDAPRFETDLPGPMNTYGLSKLAGEYAVLMSDRRNLVVRLSGLFGPHEVRGKAGNFVRRIVDQARAEAPLRVVADQWTTLTYAPEAAAAIWELVVQEVSGIIHLTNDGPCTWYEVASFILHHEGFPGEVEPLRLQEMAGVRRPRVSALGSQRLSGLGVSMRPWRAAVASYLQQLAPAALSPR